MRLVSAADLDNGACIRVIVYHDKQASTGNATTALLLDTGAAQDFLAFRNLDQTGRFRFLMDKVYTLNSPGGAGNGTSDNSLGLERHGVFNYKCNMPILYSASTGAIGDLTSNNIGILVIADTTDGRFVCQARVRYTDS